MVGIILVEIGLTDLSKSGGAMALPAPHGNDILEMYRVLQTFRALFKNDAFDMISRKWQEKF